MMRIALSIFLCLGLHLIIAQEVSFEVRVQTPSLQTVDPKVFETLEKSIQEFLNTQKWTDDSFEPHERIKCNLNITIGQEISATRFEGDFAIQATRPVYGSGYETPLITYVDKSVVFDYAQFQPFEFGENVYTSNLTSILGFYVYFILGMDYDTFSPLGGEDYFQQAQTIINAIPTAVTSVYKGWKPIDGRRNRYWMVENILNPRVRPFREAMYTYHRNGLDIMSADVDQARSAMYNAILTVEEVNKAYPNTMILQMFTDSKSEEVVEVFKKGESKEKQSIFRILSRIDATKSQLYRSMM
jgi:hypothetical protein